ncbi:hypothetical protein F959_01211 [Acinetobacter venetianus RAG-1 = CIP 110063]|jgi:hypothetical protein|uniref:DUF2474 domain-containing protein n=1 Tax=Acinetobacter venetianus (strain ATCC 31012 / DSM 23050 / BCRC 14357 / CCUG 45561 / CIP 110063 / KCTC 2702 / LMG 19082 / RAG-1) TaxID=1191460 RepID=N8YLZ3_ACIVR|nr:hypothetical protein F959_01211 [Acinetobacter venetianus RAG-1 = CIP 110063]
MKSSQIKWFIGLWILGFVGLAIIAGLFKALLVLAYQ